MLEATRALQEPLDALQSRLETRADDDMGIDDALAALQLALDHAVRTRLIHHRNKGTSLARLRESSNLSVSTISNLHASHGPRVQALTDAQSSP